MKITKEEDRYIITFKDELRITIDLDYHAYKNAIGATFKVDMFHADYEKLKFYEIGIGGISMLTDKIILRRILDMNYMTQEEYLQLLLLL